MMKAKAEAKEIKLRAKVVRADGTIEDLGVIAQHKNKSILEKVKAFLKK